MEKIKHCFQMMHMTMQSWAINQDTVHKNQHTLSQEWCKDLIHETLKGCWCICQAKRDRQELI
jgi:hypothetical protein